MIFGTKTIYFVRHGQSANNAAKVRQGSAGGLSEKGEAQARFVGERFKNNRIQLTLASPYERAQETAAVIGEYIHTPIETTPLLAERRNPSEVIGKDADSEEVTKIMDVIDRTFHDDDYHYSDEENFSELKARARKLLTLLEQRPEKRVLCVSHRIFLKMVCAYAEQGESLTSHDFVKLDFYNKVENTAIAVCAYKPLNKWLKKKEWNILAFNDFGRIVE
jgi:broad specificity phosphatase PhoE